jgi:hypothetical protein
MANTKECERGERVFGAHWLLQKIHTGLWEDNKTFD